MANWINLIGKILLALLCLYFVALDHDVEARGSRGGRSRFGGRYRSRSRIRLRVRTSSTRFAITSGTVFGASYYRRRRRFYSDPEWDPAICHNNKYIGNGTIYYYGKFICPMENQTDDWSYCCGPDGGQTCCRFFDDAGRTAGVVIGVILAVIFFGTIIFCLVKDKIC